MDTTKVHDTVNGKFLKIFYDRDQISVRKSTNEETEFAKPAKYNINNRRLASSQHNLNTCEQPYQQRAKRIANCLVAINVCRLAKPNR
ncbi:hypothetical protein HK104_005057 [Borealophlyctis nickersoniae]|nr:hypothetical protein HK104_005057 [Borealophlyctis nickersoniae]